MARRDEFLAPGLRSFRIRRGMPLAVLADRAGVARGTVYAAEAGRAIQLTKLIRMAAALEAALHEISPEAGEAIQAVA